ncbi:MAG: glycosyltransferase family 39 protein [Verrucomicrobia bacterium]|nr:glycosyltransferase family 39 protein [Verrucomicrobiota bacterium]
MSRAPAPPLLEKQTVLWLVSVLTIVLFAVANVPWQLDDYDQAKEAFTSWQVVKSGRIFYQGTPAGKVATKPPLLAWISAAIYECTRSWDLAWRVPSFLAALALALLLFRRANKYYGVLGGLIALGAFVFNLLTPRLATLVRTDMPLAFVTFLIALLFFEQIRQRRHWDNRARVALFVLLTASMLIKGPIVYAFLLPAMVLFAWRWREQRDALATGWWPWLASLAVFVCWVIGGIETVPGFYREVIVREFAARFAETVHKPQPIYFYAPHVLHKWSPWSLLLIALLLAHIRRTGNDGERPRLAPETFWLLAWSVGGFVVMSFIPSKRVDRIYPVLAPMCLLLAALVASWKRERIARWCAAVLLLAIIFTGSYVAFKIAYGIRHDRDALVKCGREFRARAAANRLRYAAVHGESEALVLYLDLPGYTPATEVVTRWNAGQIDAVIGPERAIRAIESAIHPPAEPAQFCPAERTARYLVLSRASAP